MQGAWTRTIGRCAMGTAVLLALAGQVTAGEDNQSPGLFGRLFRLGGAPSGGGGNSDSGGGSASQPNTPPSRLPYGGTYYSSAASGGSAFGNTLPAPGGSAAPTPPLPAFGGVPETPSVPASGGPAERLTPRPRVSSAVTNSDPVLTRFALGRSNDGNSFGMFLQIFADGTVVDGEGVHHVRPADLKPILEAVQSGEMYRLRGHCGAPSTDFIEYVHIVAYERRLGRLQAHSFSYSGNPQGCDHVIRHLHTAIENLQAKLSRPPAQTVGASPVGSAPAPMSPAPIVPAIPGRAPAQPSTAAGGAGAVIPLTPADPGR
jgi:hypothetical protein